MLLAVISCMLCFFYSCDHHHHSISPGIYYWKTVYGPGQYELQKLQQLKCRNMYLRLFDVDWSERDHEAIPIAPIRLPQHLDTIFNYIPVVFIKQEVLLHFKDSSTTALAEHIAAMMRGICEAPGINPKEVQIDCDWTSGTRDIYFSLLKELRKQQWFSGKILSATIRMHQVKYKSTIGIPPVDKGLLMCYNMGNIKKYDAKNSILDPDEAERYLEYLPAYPLELDVALPLFDWCLLFRDKHFKGILRDIPVVALKEVGLFEKARYNMYTCTKDSMWNGYELKKGDDLRPENAAYADILEVAKYTSQKIKQNSLNIVFFHCDSITLSKYSDDELEKVLDCYR